MRNIIIQRNERFQPIGVAVYRDQDEIRAELESQLDRTTNGTVYVEHDGSDLYGEEAVEWSLREFLNTAEQITVADDFTFPPSGFFGSADEFQDAIGTPI